MRGAEAWLGDPMSDRYLGNFPREGDLGFIAVREGQDAGAIWSRHFTEAEHGYGFVSEDVPELTMGVVAGRRGEGIGTALLHALIAASPGDLSPQRGGRQPSGRPLQQERIRAGRPIRRSHHDAAEAPRVPLTSNSGQTLGCAPTICLLSWLVGIARKWVFPILWVIIFGVAAAALVKLAFFPDLGAVADPDEPTGEIVEPQVPVVIGTILNDVTLQGTVAADAAVPILATLAGEVREVYVTQGQAVDAAPIVELRAQIVNPDGTSYVDYETVVSPIGGTLTTFSVLVGQMFTVGDDVGKVSPPSFNVSGTLAPEQQYRLISQPTEATVTITGGPAPFTCTGLQIIPAPAGADGSPGHWADHSCVVRCPGT